MNKSNVINNGINFSTYKPSSLDEQFHVCDNIRRQIGFAKTFVVPHVRSFFHNEQYSLCMIESDLISLYSTSTIHITQCKHTKNLPFRRIFGYNV